MSSSTEWTAVKLRLAAALLVAAIAGSACREPQRVNTPASRQDGDEKTLIVRPPIDTVAIGDTAWFGADTPDSLVDNWTVSDSTIARIFSTVRERVGVVAQAIGEATLRARRGSARGTARLVVLESYEPDTDVVTIKFNHCDPKIRVGDTMNVAVEVWGHRGRALTWGLGDSSVAEIFRFSHPGGDLPRTYNSPWLRGLKTGATTITATLAGQSVCFRFIVGDGVPDDLQTCPGAYPPIPVASLTILPANDSLWLEYPAGFSSWLYDAHGKGLDCRVVTWTVSDTTLMRIESIPASSGGPGRSAYATPLRRGRVTITATSEGASGSTTATIRE